VAEASLPSVFNRILFSVSFVESAGQILFRFSAGIRGGPAFLVVFLGSGGNSGEKVVLIFSIGRELMSHPIFYLKVVAFRVRGGFLQTAERVSVYFGFSLRLRTVFLPFFRSQVFSR